MNEKLVVADDMVVSVAYTLWVDEKITDSADSLNPLYYIHGKENIIRGLEKELTGLKPGDKKIILVEPEDGYGEKMADSLVELEKSLFPEDFAPAIGMPLNLQDGETGQIFQGTIESFDDVIIRVDLNHPLAGKQLKFEAEVVEVRPATEHELSAGHIHQGAGCSGCNSCGGGGCCG